MTQSKPPITRTTHTLPFDKLSPRDFERLCLWLVEREGYERAEHLGAAGSEQGRDIVAWREGALWAFQCKRVRSFGPKDALKEVDKVLGLPDTDRPAGLVFFVTCDVSDNTRRQARQRAGKMACDFWAGTELEQKVKRHADIVEEFFQAYRGSTTIIYQGTEVVVPSPDAVARQRAALSKFEGLTRRLKVFLCHASGDKPAVRSLYHRLRADGIDPWLDEENLLPGQEWELEIPMAVRSSDAVIICLSRRAITKAGYVQKEIRYALDVADEQPEGAIFLIPLRLEECQVPERLRRWHWVDLFQEEEEYERLVRALRARAESLGLGKHPWEPEMMLIPGGEFLMGSDPTKDKDARDDEQPQHSLYLPDYYLAKTPVTNAQYAAFVQATFRKPPKSWEGGPPPAAEEDHPVVYVSWDDAVAYCDWLAQVTGKPYRLPSEAEWEKAARGTDGRIYPWGDEWDAGRCNSWEGDKRDTTPVGAYPRGASPYRLLDMAGNVWEWTRSLWGKNPSKPDFRYPYDPGDGREDLEAGSDVRRVLRGGSFLGDRGRARCAVRYGGNPDGVWYGSGFRVVVSPISPSSAL